MQLLWGFLPGILVFFAMGFGYRLHPTQINWLMAGDPGVHFTGWLFFRQDPWVWPVGKMTSLLHPVGAHVLMTDSIPWVALVAKLFRSHLPESFQYTGFWLITCFALLSFFGWLIFQELGLTRAQQWIATFLITLSPPLMMRASAHFSLCAHFLILWALWVFIKTQRAQDRRYPITHILALNTLAAGLHPYLLLMTLGLTFATSLLFPLKKQLNFLWVFPLVGFSLYALGVFSIKSTNFEEGFGKFSSDLLTFFNSDRYSLFLPHIRRGGGQYEGFAYLGFGGIILFFITFFKAKKEDLFSFKKLKPIWPWIFITLFFFAFALSKHWSIAGHTFLKWDWISNRLEPLPSMFRSSGRFIWIPFYSLWVWMIFMAVRFWSRPKATVLLTCALLLNLADLKPHYLPWKVLIFDKENWQYLKDPRWMSLGQNFKHMHLVGPKLGGGSCECTSMRFHNYEFLTLAYIAHKNRLTLNSGLFGRAPADFSPICKPFCDRFAHRTLDPEGVYVLSHETEHEFLRHYAGQARCERWDEYIVCQSPQNSVKITNGSP